MGVQGSEEVAEWFDAQNEVGWQEVLQARQGCDVISLAHFLPNQVPSECMSTTQMRQPYRSDVPHLGRATSASCSLKRTGCHIEVLCPEWNRIADVRVLAGSLQDIQQPH